MTISSYVGIDVSKDHLDVCFEATAKVFRVSTGEDGLEELVQTLSTIVPELIVLEATGSLERRVVRRLVLADYPVAVVNPRNIRQFARAKGITAKTDKIDARVIAEFGKAVKPPIRALPDEQRLQLRAHLDRREQLVKQRTAELNRRRRCDDMTILHSHDQMIEMINCQLGEINGRIDQLIDQSPAYKELSNLLKSVPGIGDTTSRMLIGYLPELGTTNRRQISALAGLAPFNRDSGTWRGRRMIQGGRHTVRKALYMAALASLRCNPKSQVFFQRLQEHGKQPKVALIAVARKLLITINSMVKTKSAWTTDFA